ncbi:acyl-CoA dehydrogenase family protein [Streptomyces angustmyceticus]|uniref:acyl-CoA dehydrogenase family protein n=1 Tax=Streptomyces angustmyceticus TaxID=285578 RepID=UPI00344CC1CA
MRMLDEARSHCDRLLPGLCPALSDIPLQELERPGSPGIGLFRKYGGAGLLIPTAHGGAGAGARDAVRTMTALSSYSPSLGAAVAMHGFSVATLRAVPQSVNPLVPVLLGAVAGERLLVASAFAEGTSGQGVLAPTMTARPAGDGRYRLTGSKKPCSLSRSMDLITASVRLTAEDGGAPETAIVLVPAGAEGISVHPFWDTLALAGAESDEVRFDEVPCGPEELLRLGDDPADSERLTSTGLIWFQLIISSVYAGLAAALVEEVFRRSRGSASDRAALGSRLRSALLQLDAVALRLDDGEVGTGALADALTVRYAVQDAVADLSGSSAELLGGMAFIHSSDIAYRLAAGRALAFHPPSRTSTAAPMDAYFAGEPFVMP